MQQRIITFFSAFLFLLLSSAATAQEFGMASFYSDDFQGSRTAYGITYDKNKLTAAHKKYPPGTTLRITRLDNKKSVTVTVIDRGPFIKGRVVDVSRRAAERLDLVKDGVAEVKVEVIRLGTTAEKEKTEVVTPSEKPAPPADSRKLPADYDNPPKEKTKTEVTRAEPQREPVRPPDPKPTIALQPNAKLVGKEFQDYGLYQIQILTTSRAGFGVQVASLVNYPNVFRQIADLQAKGFNNVLVNIEKGTLDQPVYKIILGTFDSEAAAQRYRKDLKSRYRINGFVVGLAEMQAFGE